MTSIYIQIKSNHFHCHITNTTCAMVSVNLGSFRTTSTHTHTHTYSDLKSWQFLLPSCHVAYIKTSATQIRLQPADTSSRLSDRAVQKNTDLQRAKEPCRVSLLCYTEATRCSYVRKQYKHCRYDQTFRTEGVIRMCKYTHMLSNPHLLPQRTHTGHYSWWWSQGPLLKVGWINQSHRKFK